VPATARAQQSSDSQRHANHATPNPAARCCIRSSFSALYSCCAQERGSLFGLFASLGAWPYG
jgi:hypothetical protein